MECHTETSELPAFPAATPAGQAEPAVVEPDFRPEPNSDPPLAVHCDCRGGGGTAADIGCQQRSPTIGAPDRDAFVVAADQSPPGDEALSGMTELNPDLATPAEDALECSPEDPEEDPAVRSEVTVIAVVGLDENSEPNNVSTTAEEWTGFASEGWTGNAALNSGIDVSVMSDEGESETSLDTCTLDISSDLKSDFIVTPNGGDPVSILKRSSNDSGVYSAIPLVVSVSADLPVDVSTNQCAATEDEAGAPPSERSRRVSFPDGDVSLVTGYIEPRNPLGAMYNVSPEVMAAAYRQSCLKHGSRPLPTVLRQIAALPLLGDRVESFSLRGLRLDRAQCESLEEVFKKVQFNLVDVSGCGLDDDSAAALFEMIEFYDSALAVSFGGSRLGVRGWQACCRMVKASASLERLSAEGVELYDQSAATLGRSLKLSASLRVLHLEGCRLHGRPMALLLAGLKQSPTLKELYLGENELGTGDGSMLGNMLKLNLRLDLVDLRINHFDNDSVSFLLEALAQQPASGRGEGLASLNLWDNRFSVKSAGCLAALLTRHMALETLNLGRNALGDESLRQVKEALMANVSLRWLGLQECSLSCEGAVALAEILAGNTGLQRVDLRGNRVGVGGLLALARALEHNTCLVQLDLDPADEEPERMMLHARLRGLCEVNRQRGATSDDETARGDTMLRRLSAALRRVSLTCDGTAAAVAAAAVASAAASGTGEEPGEERRRLVSPSPSPSTSPLPSPCRSRFRVFKVTAQKPGSPPVPVGLLERAPRSDSESDAGSPGQSPVRGTFRVTAVSDDRAAATTAPPPCASSSQASLDTGLS